MRSNRLVLDLIGTLPLGLWANGVSYPHVLRLLLLPKLMRYLAALTSGRDAEAPLFVGTTTRLVQLTIYFFLVIHWSACAYSRSSTRAHLSRRCGD